MIPAEQEAVLLAQVRAFPDATLRAHCQRWAEETGTVLSEATLCRTLQRLAVTVKNNA